MQPDTKKMFLKKFGTTLKSIREERNISIKELASVLKITTQQYGNIENGKSSIDICRLSELSNYLKVSLHVLLDLESSYTYNNTVNTKENGSVIQGNNTVNHFAEKEYLEFLKSENTYLKQKLDEMFQKVLVRKTAG